MSVSLKNIALGHMWKKDIDMRSQSSILQVWPNDSEKGWQKIASFPPLGE